MAAIDEKISNVMNDEHAKRTESINKRRREPPPFKIGDKVWYHPERRPGTDKLAPLWKGPCKVTAREGQHSYVVELTPGKLQAAHRSQLKPHVVDEFVGEPYELHYFSYKAEEVEAGPEDWIVEDILDHRKGPRGPEFLVKWQGWGPEYN